MKTSLRLHGSPVVLEIVYVLELESAQALELKSPLEFDKKTQEVEDVI